MPTNYKRYHPDWKDVIRPTVLKRDGYACKFCRLSNRAIVYADKAGKWQQADDWMKENANVHGVRLIKVILTVAHLNHLVIDNRLVNLAATCQQCHLNHDRTYKAYLKKAAGVTRPAQLIALSQEPGGETLLPLLFAVQSATRRRLLNMEQIIGKRPMNKTRNAYDLTLTTELANIRQQYNDLLTRSCEILSIHYSHPDPLQFYVTYAKEEERLIGIKNPTNDD